MPSFQLFLRLLDQDQDMAHATDPQQRVSIDVQDPIGGGPLSALRSEVTLRFTAHTNEPEKLDDRVMLRPIENVTNQLAIIGHSTECEDPGEHLVAVPVPEPLSGQLEQRDPDGQDFQHTRQQLGRLA
jgi:hypothetical protein